MISSTPLQNISPFLSENFNSSSFSNLYVKDNVLTKAGSVFRGINWFSKPSAQEKDQKLDEMRTCIENNSASFTQENIDGLSPEQKKNLYSNIQILEKDLSTRNKHLPVKVLQVMRLHQERELGKLLKDSKPGTFFIESLAEGVLRSQQPLTVDNIYLLVFSATRPNHRVALLAKLADYPALKDLVNAVKAKEKLEAITDQSGSHPAVAKGLTPFKIAGQLWLIHSPKYEFVPDKSNMGNAWKTFLEKVATRSDFIINLLEMHESVDAKNDKQENNYIPYLSISQDHTRLSMDREREIFSKQERNSAIETASYRTLMFQYPPEMRTPTTPTIIHFDGVKDGEWDLLKQTQVTKLLREIKNHFREIESKAQKEGKPIQDLCLLVHCRQGLNRTPFYMALFSFMEHPEWVRGKTNEEIINQFLSLIDEISKSPLDPKAMSVRAPLPSYVREFCRPQFLEALRDIIG